ncbi:MAG: hydrogenase 4 subunit F, partial [Parcubacteria group bacterium]|nr:hydrogenase 4 subunit F [Parcubacteria group bacterium]
MLLPLIIGISLLAALLSFTVRGRNKLIELTALVALGLEVAASFFIAKEVADKGVYQFAPFWAVEPLSALLLALTALIGFLATWYSVGYLRQEAGKEIINPRQFRHYYTLLHLFLCAMYGAIAATSPMVMWVAIEATTLFTAYLVSFYDTPDSVEAAWKYLIINSVGLLLGLFGVLLFMASASAVLSESSLITWQSLADAASLMDSSVIKLAFIFSLIGYGTKVGFVPMHTWKPDTYGKAPVPIVLLFSGALMNVAFLAILRLKAITDHSVGEFFTQNLLIFFGVISVVIPAFIMLIQRNYRRLLAYSSIEHAGLISLGFGFGGFGAFGAMMHMIYHALTKSLLFLAAGNILLKYSTSRINGVKGMLTALPVTSVIFILGVLAIAGLPPLGMFFSEYYILLAGITDYPWITALVIFALVLVFIGFLKHLHGMLFGAPEGVERGEPGPGVVAPVVVLLVLTAAAGLLLPGILVKLLNSGPSVIGL